LTPTAFAAVPTFTTYVADDPDDADNILSAGDTLTIIFSEATNATAGGTISQAEINANFTDGDDTAPDFGTTYTGVWGTPTTTLVITLTDPSGATLNLGTSTIAGRTTTNISSVAEGTNAELIDMVADTATLFGDFGLKSAEGSDDISSVPDEIKVKTLNVEKSSYFMREEILFFGTVDDYKFGSAVTIIIRNPSNNFLTLISTFPDKDGYFEAKIKTDSKFKTDGTYTATAFADDPNKGRQAIFYFSRDAPPPPPVKTSPVQSIQTESTTTAESTTPKPKSRPSFVDPQKDPQSYVDRYNKEVSYKEWFDENYPDYTIYEAVGLAKPTKEKVPAWIKNNAEWWSEGQIDDRTFVSGIQFLITEKIIDIPDLPEQESEKPRPSFVDPQKDPQSYVDRYNKEVSYKEWFDENYPDYTIEEAVGMPESIPDWIKNNAEWWSQGLITEDDFVKGIEFLVKNGIIRV